MSDYTVTVGLEIHAELSTATKMFCTCANDPDEERPNFNICPVCTAQPGALPVINKEAVRKVLMVGAALGADLADFSEFDRKNYFYPDIPKGYQITQYKYPFVSGGSLAGVAITRVHLEEDTGSSRHDEGDYSLVDLNRAGVPLMELVTEPVIHDAETATRFAKELQLLLRTLGAGKANMEKGEMRVEANISIARPGEPLGTKVEVKNLNSFKSVGDAIRYEIIRQEEVLAQGGTLVQETRGWDESTGKTFSQRKKESANDYRYFPEPDLPKLVVSELWSKEAIQAMLPELPDEKRARYARAGLTPEALEFFVLDPEFGGLLDAVITHARGDDAIVRLSANYLSSDLASLSKTAEATASRLGKVTPEGFVALMTMAQHGDLSSRGAKDVLAALFREGGDPKEVADRMGLMQKNDPEAIRAIVQEIITAQPVVVAEYRAGKEASLQFLVGQGMKASKGSANPQMLAQMFKEMLA